MELINKINDKTAVVGVIGLGYVGLPLALEFAHKGFNVLGFDLDDNKINFISAGKSYIKHIPSEKIKPVVDKKLLNATTDFSRLPEADSILICVPTPLDEHREPDMTYIENSARVISQYLRRGQLVVLESSTYPGTTEEILLPLFENAPAIQKKGKPEMELAGIEESHPENFTEPDKFVVGEDFYLAFSPEREDPNNSKYNTATIPKVIGGVTPKCLEVCKSALRPGNS
jgi:UDP-N-acetyl-D-glucosamine dehydrogenase